MSQDPARTGDTGLHPVDPGTLHGALAARLGSGIGSVSDADREAYAVDNDACAWKNAGLRQALRDLADAQEAHTVGIPAARRSLSGLLADSESEYLVRAILHRPDHLLNRVLPDVLAPKSARPEAVDPFAAWSVFTVCVEALWDHVTGAGAPAHQHLEPLAARTRFLALSEPFRHHRDSEDWSSWWAGKRIRSFFGEGDGRVHLVRKAREARDLWRSHLDRHQSLPLFDHAPPSAVEWEVRTLAFQDPVPEHCPFSGGPLALSAPEEQDGDGIPPKLNRPAPTAADQTVLGEAVEQHLLPRFAVVASWSAVWGLYQRTQNRWALCMYGLLGVAMVAAVAAVCLALCTEWVTFTCTLYAISFFYALIGVSTLVMGRVWAMPLMLRLPAAGAVGLIVLVAFHPTWWENVALGWWLPIVLGGSSFGYLLLEVRNHNPGTVNGNEGVRTYLSLALRALAVAATGLVHALFTAVVGMVVVTTVFGENGGELRQVWEGASSEGDPTAILVAATFWCLAAGVFSQILWDDQPITAPLSHRRWRDER